MTIVLNWSTRQGSDPQRCYLQKIKKELETNQSFQLFKATNFQLLPNLKGKTILEIGCGQGDDAFQLAHRVGTQGQVCAIDICSDFIGQANKTNSFEQLSFSICDLNHLSFKDAFFDLVRVERVLQHIPKLESAVQEMKRVLKPNSFLLAIEPIWQSLTIESSNTTLTRKIIQFNSTKMIKNGQSVNQLQTLLSRNYSSVKTTVQKIQIESVSTAVAIYALESCLTKMIRLNIISKKEAELWLNQLYELEQKQKFSSTLTLSSFLCHL